MGFVRFYNDGYDYCDDGNYVYYNEDVQHNLLFSYVSKDLSKLPEMLEQYVSKKMNISTFELTEYVYKKEDSMEMEMLLADAHPFYKYELAKVMLKAIGEYFNALLYNSNLHNETNKLYADLDAKWYMERFKKITSNYLEPSNNYHRLFFQKYQYNAGISDIKPSDLDLILDFIDDAYDDKVADEFEVVFSGAYAARPPIGFYDELRTQEKVRRLLFWILDVSELTLKELTIPQRIWLYKNLFRNSDEVSSRKNLSFNTPILYRAGGDYSVESDQYCELQNLFAPLFNEVNNFHTRNISLTSEASLALQQIVDRAKKESENKIFEKYRVSALRQLLSLEIFSMIDSNTSIKQCRNCGTYFVVTNLNKEYCDRIAENDKTCANVGPQRYFEKKLKTEKPLEIYNRAYKTHHARRRKGNMTAIEFDEWSREAKNKLILARAGELDVMEFEKWLKI